MSGSIVMRYRNLDEKEKRERSVKRDDDWGVHYEE